MTQTILVTRNFYRRLQTIAFIFIGSRRARATISVVLRASIVNIVSLCPVHCHFVWYNMDTAASVGIIIRIPSFILNIIALLFYPTFICDQVYTFIHGPNEVFRPAAR